MLVEATTTTNLIAPAGSIIKLNPYQIVIFAPPSGIDSGDGTGTVIILNGMEGMCKRIPVRETITVLDDRFRRAVQYWNTAPRGYGGPG